MEMMFPFSGLAMWHLIINVGLSTQVYPFIYCRYFFSEKETKCDEKKIIDIYDLRPFPRRDMIENFIDMTL